MSPAPVSAILPTWNRLDDLPRTLKRLSNCTPPPAAILVHVDAGDEKTVPWLQSNRSDVHILKSSSRQGPGGGRNRLLNAVSTPFAASFDDDSYPIDDDYFQRVIDAFARHPDAGVLAAAIFHRDEPTPPLQDSEKPVASFVGCGCAYRRTAWSDVEGYVPLALAYGMEEADLSLQMLDAGWSIVHDHRLRVFHDTSLEHRNSPSKTAGAIVNRALLAYVRYPASYFWVGVAQYLNRILWSLRSGRARGVLQGIIQTPRVLREFAEYRNPVRPSTLRKANQLRSQE